MSVEKVAKEMINTTEFPEVVVNEELINLDKCGVAKREIPTKVYQKKDLKFDDGLDEEDEEDIKYCHTLDVLLVIFICILVALLFSAAYLTLDLVGIIWSIS